MNDAFKGQHAHKWSNQTNPTMPNGANMLFLHHDHQHHGHRHLVQDQGHDDGPNQSCLGPAVMNMAVVMVVVVHDLCMLSSCMQSQTINADGKRLTQCEG